MGIATAGNLNGVNVRSSVDVIASVGVSSGMIGGQVSFSQFSISVLDRLATFGNAKATFVFTPTAGGTGPSTITLNYPSLFFATGFIPTFKLSTVDATISSGASSATSIVMTTGGSGIIVAGIAVTITMEGIKMGDKVTLGSSEITVTTNLDPITPTALHSGKILANNIEFDPALPPGPLIAGESQSFTRGFPFNLQSTKCTVYSFAYRDMFLFSPFLQ
jgi:hypothetical protein